MRVGKTVPAGTLDPTMPAPVIACLHHLEAPFTGHAGLAMRAAGAELDERRLREGDPLPSLDEVDAIVSFGGEQSVVDSADALAAEAELLREAVAREMPVLGVCLGAQLLAHALVGSVRRLPRRMVAWAPLEPLPAANGDPLLGALPPGAAGLHWNEDGFEPPPGAVELLRRPNGTAPGTGPRSGAAARDGDRAGSCEAFRFGARAWGVQFHAEVDEPALEGWYRAWGAVALPQAAGAEADARAADAVHLPAQRALSDALFGGFARVATAQASPTRGALEQLAAPYWRGAQS
jgi:GMP synthase (glutamine-hydrolysing)